MSDLKRKKSRIIMLAVLVTVITVTTCVIYLNDFYHTDRKAVAAFTTANELEMKTANNGNIVFVPEDATAGFIFYPGGKVEHTSYVPLMKALASEGVLCVLVEMPFRLAVFDMDAAQGIQEQYPQIENWYIGGHSLGGSMAASYLEKCEEIYEGLILLSSYSTADLSDKNLEVLSIYGSEDKVMNRENYEENKINLPIDFEEVIIDGGCHAYFGMYGPQEGDGTPKITNEEQIEKTVDAIIDLISD